jgi:hypothetical protein
MNMLYSSKSLILQRPATISLSVSFCILATVGPSHMEITFPYGDGEQMWLWRPDDGHVHA